MEWQCHAQFTLEALDKVFFFSAVLDGGFMEWQGWSLCAWTEHLRCKTRVYAVGYVGLWLLAS